MSPNRSLKISAALRRLRCQCGFTHTNVLSVAINGTVNGTTTTSNDATLSALTLSGVTLDSTFGSATED